MSKTWKVMLSYCHEDSALKDSLLRLLQPRLRIMKGMTFEWWEDSQLNLGLEWRSHILKRLREADFALQLVSPAFLSSSFIVANEIPPLVGPAATIGALPVALRPVGLDEFTEWHGIDALEVFRYESRSFSQMRTAAAKDDFAMKLAEAIRRRLGGLDGYTVL